MIDDELMLNRILDVLDVNGHKPTGGQLEALRTTPARWWRMLSELTEGYAVDVAALLAVTFDDVPSDQMVVLADVPFSSLCEHHLMPFSGTATVGYLPRKKRVVGLSKLARLVDAHARRLQVQERMTADVAEDLRRHLLPLGAGCVIKATHSCMACRGIRKTGVMVTSSLQGVFAEPVVRAEFLALAR